MALARNSRVRFHARWDSIIGPEASELRYRAFQARFFAFYSCIIAVVFAILAGALRGHTGLHGVLYGIAIAALVSMCIWIIVWFVRRPRQYAAASIFLGIPVNARNFPPFNPSAFSKWCERHGARPSAPPPLDHSS